MKKTSLLRKALVMICSMALIACISVAATIAYFTDSEAVTNTFTVGKVGISMDEAPVDNEGKATSGDRVTKNKYHLVPGQVYDKDPIVYVDEKSEDCWLFVKVDNGLAGIQKGVEFVIPAEEEGAEPTKEMRTVEEQIVKNGWTKLTGVDGVDNVWYRTHAKTDDKAQYAVFTKFAIADEAHNKAPEEGKTDDKYIEGYAEACITVTAYAIQKSGFDTDPVEAWKAYNKQNPPVVTP